MKITKSIPVDGTYRIRKAFALCPKWFDHGSLKEPLRTMVWLEYYYVVEYYQYNQWNYSRRSFDLPRL